MLLLSNITYMNYPKQIYTGGAREGGEFLKARYKLLQQTLSKYLKVERQAHWHFRQIMKPRCSWIANLQKHSDFPFTVKSNISL